MNKWMDIIVLDFLFTTNPKRLGVSQMQDYALFTFVYLTLSIIPDTQGMLSKCLVIFS